MLGSSENEIADQQLGVLKTSMKVLLNNCGSVLPSKDCFEIFVATPKINEKHRTWKVFFPAILWTL